MHRALVRVCQAGQGRELFDGAHVAACRTTGSVVVRPVGLDVHWVTSGGRKTDRKKHRNIDVITSAAFGADHVEAVS